MRDHTGTARPTVHTSKCHSARHSAWGRFESQIHTVLGDGACIVGRGLPREMGTFRTLHREEGNNNEGWPRQATLLMRIADGAPGKPGMQVLNAATSENKPLPQLFIPHTRNL